MILLKEQILQRQYLRC